jgi:hypothetical protein
MSKARKTVGAMVLLLLMFIVVYILYGILIAGEIDLIFTTIPLDATVPTPMPSIWGTQISEAEIEQYFEGKGFEFWEANMSGAEYQVEINTDLLSDGLLATSLEDAAYLASYLDGREPRVETLSIEIYYIGYPLYRIRGPVGPLAAAYEKETEDFINQTDIEDIRPLDFKIQSDLWAFDYLATVESIDESSAVISLVPYQENATEMSNDLVAMAFIIIQEAPFLDSMAFIIEYEETTTTVTFTTDDVLAYMSDEISFESLMENSGTSSL